MYEVETSNLEKKKRKKKDIPPTSMIVQDLLRNSML